MKYKLYTDGSDLKHTTKRLGIGGILVDVSGGSGFGVKIGEFSEELDREKIYRNFGTEDCSNPFAEMVAAYTGLTRFSQVFKPEDEVTLVSDFTGVESWCTGKWKAKLPYIKKIVEEVKRIINSAPWKVNFLWIKSHQNKSVLDPDAYWNNEVDLLAKGIC